MKKIQKINFNLGVSFKLSYFKKKLNVRETLKFDLFTMFILTIQSFYILDLHLRCSWGV